MKKNRLPSYFISHGGGPWPYMEGPFRRNFDQLQLALENIPKQLPSPPKAVLVISGHWEEREFTLSSSPHPGMIYDYGGFPEETYSIQYPAPGAPELAQQVQGLLQNAGLQANLDSERGYDHGTFSTLAVMFPNADVPVVQMSMKEDFDPAEHIRAGQALATLREQGVLIIGSGLSYHNLRLFGEGAEQPSQLFDQWLQHSLLELKPEERAQAISHWDDAPAARQAHPREDHLIPLMVTLGSAYNEQAYCDYHEDNFFGHIHVSNFRFGELG